MAPKVGFEPTTHRLTADCSTTELLRNGNSKLYFVKYKFYYNHIFYFFKQKFFNVFTITSIALIKSDDSKY